MTEPPPLVRIGVLAAEVGVSPDTLRHYERLGLLRATRRSGVGYRLYDRAAADRVRLIRAGLELGLSLRQLAAVLGERDRGGAPCRKVRSLVADQLSQLERRMTELTRHRETLVRLLSDWDRRLADTPQGRRAELLASVPSRRRPGEASDPSAPAVRPRHLV